MNGKNTNFLIVPMTVIAFCICISGCGAAPKEKSHDFFTSGNREADQRADQRMAKTEQLRGTGEGAGEKASAKITADGKSVVKADEKKSLFDRLGGQDAIVKIVDDFTVRALADPRINWERKGVKYGGLSVHHNKSVEWSASPQNVEQLKKHLVQFLALSTGGPAFYDGKDIKDAHANLHIANAEFDATVGDLKASLDKLQVPNKEQKELLSIVESTRPQIVQER
jgi:hemoglobin